MADWTDDEQLVGIVERAAALAPAASAKDRSELLEAVAKSAYAVGRSHEAQETLARMEAADE